MVVVEYSPVAKRAIQIPAAIGRELPDRVLAGAADRVAGREQQKARKG